MDGEARGNIRLIVEPGGEYVSLEVRTPRITLARAIQVIALLEEERSGEKSQRRLRWKAKHECPECGADITETVVTVEAG